MFSSAVIEWAAMEDPYVEALKRLIGSTDGGRFAVAEAIHANEQTLYQITSGIPLKSGKPRTVGRDLRERLDRAYPGWDAPKRGAPTVLTDFFMGRHGTIDTRGVDPPDQSVAHIVSLDKSTVLSPTNWETLMDMPELPLQYAALMPDDAIDEVVARGTYLAFDRSLKPRPGDKIAVRCGGLLHVRIYEQTVGGWIGRATRRGYTSFDSNINPIECVGVVSLTGRAPE